HPAGQPGDRRREGADGGALPAADEGAGGRPGLRSHLPPRGGGDPPARGRDPGDGGRPGGRGDRGERRHLAAGCAGRPGGAGRAAPVTPAVAAAKREGVPFALHEYEHDPAAASYGLEAAEKLGVDPARLFKTLVASVDGKLAVAVV